MNVSILRPTDPSTSAVSDRYDVCIVVDVLRATTTAPVLCRRGPFCVVRTPDDLTRLPARMPGYALFSELSGVVSDLPRFDNSPIQARDVDLEGRTPVLVTTNGTLAIAIAASIADEVLLASFVNLTATVDYVRAHQRARVAVMPAGHVKKAEVRTEDDLCANAIVARLTGAALDLEATLAACRADPRTERRRVKEENLGADIDLALSVDAVPVVPRVMGGADQGWFEVVEAARLP